MSALVLLNLLNELGEKIRCEAMPSILSVFPNDFNKFNDTGARVQDSIWAPGWQKGPYNILHYVELRTFKKC